MSLTTHRRALTFPKVLVPILLASDIPPVTHTLLRTFCEQLVSLLNYVSCIFPRH